MPPGHPFNSLHALRLVVAAGEQGCTNAAGGRMPGAAPNQQNVETAFDMVWKEGRDLQDTKELAELARRLGLQDPQAAAADEDVKAKLKANTETAIARGVFGVPSFLLGDTLFWGQDSLEMMLDYLKDSGLFDTAEMHRVNVLPVGTMRKEVTKS
jgi:2-hydroxychromene-2-carboxylate isomerase